MVFALTETLNLVLCFMNYSQNVHMESQLSVSKIFLGHILPGPLLAAPPCPAFVTDSVNRHTYLLQPEICWGGDAEEGGVSG